MEVEHIQTTELKALTLYTSPAHPCGYIPGRQAATQFVDPYQAMNIKLYSGLAEHGFRRSGEHVYRPRCERCNACIPSRVPVADFKPSRTQRRIWRRNHDLSVTGVSAGFHAEHFMLYTRYVAARHPGSDMDAPDPAQYRGFLMSTWCDTLFYEFRLGRQLVAVAVVDRMVQGLSAVYTFFDPVCDKRSLGVYAVLWEIVECQRLGLPWLYLGYWIRESNKMRYKEHYKPLEIYQTGLWQRL